MGAQASRRRLFSFSLVLSLICFPLRLMRADSGSSVRSVLWSQGESLALAPQPASSLTLFSVFDIEQKTAVAVAHCKSGKGCIKLNGKSMETIRRIQHIYCQLYLIWTESLSLSSRRLSPWTSHYRCAPLGQYRHLFSRAGSPLELVQPDILRLKAFEPVMLIGRHKLKNLDIRIRVKGGGHVSQIYGKEPQYLKSLACSPALPCSHSPSTFQGHPRILPKIHRRAVQAGHQGHSHSV